MVACNEIGAGAAVTRGEFTLAAVPAARIPLSAPVCVVPNGSRALTGKRPACRDGDSRAVCSTDEPTTKSLPNAARFGHNRGVNFREKIVSWDQLPAWRAAIRASGKKLVVTNGCFDLLHLGHVSYLEAARNLGDALLIGVNGDDSVRQLKGDARPVNAEADRAAVLAALQSVDGACIFTEKTATRFLAAAQPDIYVKGGDYTLETVNQDERRAVEQGGGRVVIIPFVPGKSTTSLLEKISRL
jgi:rfaE bifunctional protein nucleotidyltransferase chain/domain